MANLQELPRFHDGISYLYVEHGKVDQQHKAIAWYGPHGEIAVPAAALGVLFLGPGTSVTHAAIKTLAASGCLVCWVGEDEVRFYASGMGETRSSRNLLLQASAWADRSRHLDVVHRMYRLRFAGSLPEELTLQQLRGLEGVRVREAYAAAARDTGVIWNGRSYKRDRWQEADPVNRALSAGAACLYGVCHAAIVSGGYSPALGFIHTGKQLSFVYDIADLYKADTVIPAAFSAAAEAPQLPEKRVREKLREEFRRVRLLERIMADLGSLFEVEPGDDDTFEDDSRPGDLWDDAGTVEGGVAYGGDGP